MAEISPLRRRMIEDMTVRNLSPATQRSYISAESKFSRYFGRSPDHLGLEDVRAFQIHLVATGISWPALNQIVCALRFFYGVTLGHDTIPERIAYPHKLFIEKIWYHGYKPKDRKSVSRLAGRHERRKAGRKAGR
jgi:integrase/recombinase XerD